MTAYASKVIETFKKILDPIVPQQTNTERLAELQKIESTEIVTAMASTPAV